MQFAIALFVLGQVDIPIDSVLGIWNAKLTAIMSSCDNVYEGDTKVFQIAVSTERGNLKFAFIGVSNMHTEYTGNVGEDGALRLYADGKRTYIKASVFRDDKNGKLKMEGLRLRVNPTCGILYTLEAEKFR